MNLAHPPDAAWAGQAEQAGHLDFYNAALADILRPHLGSRILEVGIGIGNVARHLLPGAASYVGLDNVEEHIRLARERFAGAPFSGHVVDLEDPGQMAVLAGLDFDSIVSVNCLEHLREDGLALRLIAEHAAPGTRVAVLVPAHQALYGPLDAQAEHHRRYDKALLRRTLEQAGFRVDGARYCNMAGALAWFLASRLGKKKGAEAPGEASAHAMTPRWKALYAAARLARLPAMALLALERRLSPPFGLSVAAWGRRA